MVSEDSGQSTGQQLSSSRKIQIISGSSLAPPRSRGHTDFFPDFFAQRNHQHVGSTQERNRLAVVNFDCLEKKKHPLPHKLEASVEANRVKLSCRAMLIILKRHGFQGKIMFQNPVHIDGDEVQPTSLHRKDVRNQFHTLGFPLSVSHHWSSKGLNARIPMIESSRKSPGLNGDLNGALLNSLPCRWSTMQNKNS